MTLETKPENLLESVRKLFGGFDFFISYGSADGQQYARTLDAELKRYRCFLDERQMPAGQPLEESTIRGIRRSNVLLLLVTPAAASSVHVQQELQIANEYGKVIIVLNIEGTFDHLAREHPVRQLVKDSIFLPRGTIEKPDRPSSAVLEGIERGYAFTRQELKRRLAIAAVATFCAAMLMVIAWVQYRARITATVDHANRVASRANVLLQDQPDLALSLAAEAWQIAHTPVTTSTLLTTLTSHPNVVAFLGNRPMISLLGFGTQGLLWGVDSDGTAEAWDTTNFSLVHRFPIQVADCRATISPASDRLIAACGSELRQWSLADGTAFPVLKVGLSEMTDLAVSPNGKFAAVSSYSEGRVAFIETRSGRIFLLPPLRKDELIGPIGFSPDSAFLAIAQNGIASFDNGKRTTLRDRYFIDVIRVSDWSTSQRLYGFGDSIETIAFDQHGTQIAAGGDDPVICVWNASDGHLSRRLSRRAPRASALAFGRTDRELLVADGIDHSIQLWNLDSSLRPDGTTLSETVDRFAVHTGDVRSITVSPDRHLMASLGLDNRLVLWELGNRYAIGSTTDTPPSDIPIAFAAAPNSLFGVMSSVKTSSLTNWDLARDISIGQPNTEHHSSVYALSFSHDGSMFASGGRDGIVLWEIQDHALQKKIHLLPNTFVTRLAFHSSRPLLACGTDDGEILLIDTDKTEVLHRWNAVTAAPMPITALVFDKKTDVLWSGDARSTLARWSLSGDRLGSELTLQQYISDLVISPDGDLLVSAGQDGSIKVRRSSSGSWAAMNHRHRLQAHSIAFSSKGDFLISGGLDGDLIFWDPTTGESVGNPIAILHDSRANHFVVAVCFDSEGDLYVVSDVDVTRWHTSPEVWAEVARRMAGKPLSKEEREKYVNF